MIHTSSRRLTNAHAAFNIRSGNIPLAKAQRRKEKTLRLRACARDHF
jgi:hypothetical protein